MRSKHGISAMKAVVSAIVLCTMIPITSAACATTPDEVAILAEDNAFLYLHKGNDRRTAIEYYSIAIRLNPKHAEAYSGRGKARLGFDLLPGIPLNVFADQTFVNENKGQILADYTNAIRYSSDPARKALMYCDRGFIFKLNKEWDKAIADYTDAIGLDPYFVDAFVGRGDAYMGKGELDKAIDDFSQAIRINPAAYMAYSRRIAAYSKRGDWDKVIADYTEQIRLCPEIDETAAPSLHWGRGHAYLKKGDEEKAAADFRKAFFDPATYCEGYSGPLFYEDNLLFGHLYLRKEELSDHFDGQIANYTALLKLEKNLPLAFWDRAVAYMGKGDARKAIADFTEVLRLDPKANAVYLHRAVAYLKEHNGKKALADSTAYVRLNPNHDLGYRIQGDAHAMTGEWDKAISDYTRFIKIAEKNGDIRGIHSDRNIFWDRGKAYLKVDNRPKAIEDFKEALGLGDPIRQCGMYFYGWSKNELEDIVAKYSELINLEPRCAGAYCRRGEAYEALGQDGKAIDDYSMAIHLNPRGNPRPPKFSDLISSLDPDPPPSPYRPAPNRKKQPYFNGALCNRANLYNKLGQWDKAIDDFTSWIELDSEAGDAYAGRAFAYMEKSDWDKAIADWKEAIGFESHYWEEAHIGWGKACAMKGDLDNAIVALTEAREKELRSVELFCGRAYLYAKKGELEKAMADYAEAVKYYPLTAWPAYVGLGDVCAKTGKLDEAIDDYTIAIAIHPEAPLVWCGRGDVYAKLGNLEKAVADYSEAIRLDPKCSSAYRGRAKALKSQGRLEAAQEDIQQAEKLGPTPQVEFPGKSR